LDLTDGKLSSPYAFTVIIYNESPFYSVGPMDYTVKFGKELIYPLPKVQELENLPVQTKIYPVEYKPWGAV